MSPPATEVLARERELASIHDSLRELALLGGALVLDGAPGIGKTTLWREGLDFADREGWTVLRASCVQSESQLAYTTLGDLLDPVLDAALDDIERNGATIEVNGSLCFGSDCRSRRRRHEADHRER